MRINWRFWDPSSYTDGEPVAGNSEAEWRSFTNLRVSLLVQIRNLLIAIFILVLILLGRGQLNAQGIGIVHEDHARNQRIGCAILRADHARISVNPRTHRSDCEGR